MSGQARRPDVRTPLGVIGLFLSVTEVFATVAVIRTDGWIQALFAIFCVSFPICIAAAFFAVLLKRPEVLYAPGDYSEAVPVDAFVHAMTMRQREISVQARGFERGLEKVLQENGRNDAVDVKRLVARAVSTAEREAQESSITVDVSEFRSDTRFVRFVADERSAVDDFLDFVYFALAPTVEPFTYGRAWALQRQESRDVIGDLGSIWAARKHRSRDDRPLSSVDLQPGDHLRAVRVRRHGATSERS